MQMIEMVFILTLTYNKIQIVRTLKNQSMSIVTCRNCGADMVVSQPDRIHTIVDRKVLNWKDYVKFTIKCRKCAISNILYWSKPKDN